MQAEPNMTMSDTSTLKLPAELLAELKRHTKQKTDYRLESFKPTLIERILGVFGLR
jgi:hypothetical protein